MQGACLKANALHMQHVAIAVSNAKAVLSVVLWCDVRRLEQPLIAARFSPGPCQPAVLHDHPSA
jgi:hypothetical protein